MISFTIRLKFKPEDRDEIHEALRAATQASRLEPGCVTYIPHTVDGDSDTVVIYEQYKDAAAADAHAANKLHATRISKRISAPFEDARLLDSRIV